MNIYSSLANNALGNIQNSLTLASGGTNLIVDTALDSKLSSLTFPFYLTLWSASFIPDTSVPATEIVQVTARPSAANYTIVRAMQSTSAQTWQVGDNIGLLWTTSNATELITQKLSQDGSQIYAADTGAADAYAVTLSPIPQGYNSGFSVVFRASHNNTTASTLNVNGLGAVYIKKQGTLDLDANDIITNQVYTVTYDSVTPCFQLFTGSRRNNYVATTNPAVGNDNTQGYQVGSVWINTSTNFVFTCTSSATGAAVWENAVKIASPVQGDIIYHNGTIWTPLAPGTAGQVLTTQGASANPSWSSLVKSTLIASSGAGTNATVSFTNLGGYNSLTAVYCNVVSAGNNVTLRVALSSDNGSTYGSANTIAIASSYTSFVNGKFTIYNPNQSSLKIADVASTNTASGGGMYVTSLADASITGAITALQFSFSAGNLNGGTIYICGN